LRYAYSRFKLVEAEILKDRPVRNGRVMPVEASDFKAKSALYLPIEAQYDYLLNLPEDIKGSALTSKDGQVMTSLGEVVNNAMALIEDQSAQLTGILPKNYTDFSDELLAEILRIFNNSALDEVGGDIIGRIYEYFLNKFAKNIASDDGVFFTPKSLVKMIVNVLEPTHGTLFDPACGSGGMFIQSGDFVNSHGMNANSAMTFYGQEKVEYNAQLCLMNMAVHGLTGVIKSGDEGNSFYNDAHQLDGRCDYIMANPPFNVDKVKSESTLAAGRLPFGMPSINNKSKEISNANYLWISYFYSYLNDTGRAGFVMASSATDSQGKDKDIRESLVKTGAVDVMVSVGNNFFYTKSLPCSLWFFDKAKLEAIKDKVLFIDARNYYTVVDRTLNEWTEWQLKNLNAIVWLYRGEVEKYIALLNEYRQILGEDQSFAGYIESLSEQVKAIEAEGKQAVADAGRSKGKKVQQEYDEKVKTVKEILTIAQEAQWLYEKFGDGEYVDIPGLCKIAYITNEAKGDNEGISIEDKNWSLTPGAYVGVAPVEDDGVNFEERMAEIHEELLALQQESNILMETISNNMKEMGL
jgi:putative modification enzyme transmembrane protein